MSSPEKKMTSKAKNILRADADHEKPKIRERAKTISSADESSVLIAHNIDEAATVERKSRANRYDPYSFLENMTIPFDFAKIGKSKNQTVESQVVDESSVVTGAGESGVKKPMPHCKACTDFKTWMELTAHPRRNMSREEREQKECPPDSELLGRNTWAFLHTMAAYYPEKPTPEQQHNMKKFIALLSMFYPCHKCASHLREDLKTNIPETCSNIKLSDWFCKLHNSVNVRLGKVEFDCSKVLERWRDGWKDGTCD
ncbi:unnamed protein product [Lymnaea stagnalis]|uniref:Sulfhydryl oxidase n=1 Tax=Lymnaea stagnalis TaxID=6523 RepID=A0AAV2H252_LYMST